MKSPYGLDHPRQLHDLLRLGAASFLQSLPVSSAETK
jgi:hypothetical protein